MQDPVCGLPRTLLLGTWVNKPMMALVHCLQRPNNSKNSSIGGCAAFLKGRRVNVLRTGAGLTPWLSPTLQKIR